MTISLRNLSFHYTREAKRTPALSGINLTIGDHEFVAIVGPTGSGKTTLFQHFTGLLRPSSGEIVIDGETIPPKGAALAEIRRKIGLVFQFPEKQLFEETVFDDVAFGPKNMRFSPEQIESTVSTALSLVDLDFTALRERNPHHLSEGEKRRVALAGVLAMNPQVLVLDEPTACLDPQGVRCIENILRRLYANGVTVILISHNIDLVFRLAERVIILAAGTVQYDGDKETLLSREVLLEDLGLELPRMYRILRARLGPKMSREWAQCTTLEEVRHLLQRTT